MSRNLLTVVGALATLAILLSSPFLMTASAVSPNVYNADRTINVEVGQALNVDILPYLPEKVVDPAEGNTLTTSFWGEGSEVTAYMFAPEQTSYPDWLTVTQGVRNVPSIKLTGTPSTSGTYQVALGLGYKLLPDQPHAFMNVILKCTITVAEPIPPTPYSVTLISNPAPTSISTSAGTVTLTGGSATIMSGTVMHEPDLQRERQILHRWTDAAGNTYDWSKPVAKDLTLTADWREHFTAAVKDNTATVTISPSLPTEYITDHKVDWGDNTVDRVLTHRYAVPGTYVIKVTSGDWYNTVSSSTSVTVERVTELPTYTVSFSGNGSASAIPAQTVTYGDKAVKPADPTRDGYNFTGWYLSGKLYNFATPVAGNMLLTAGWTATDGKDDKDEQTETNIMALALAAGAVIALLATFITRHPAALLLTIILALAAIALEVMP
jgi:uncharacterized repeat protein (TIGR02543 family)